MGQVYHLKGETWKKKETKPTQVRSITLVHVSSNHFIVAVRCVNSCRPEGNIRPFTSLEAAQANSRIKTHQWDGNGNHEATLCHIHEFQGCSMIFKHSQSSESARGQHLVRSLLGCRSSTSQPLVQAKEIADRLQRQSQQGQSKGLELALRNQCGWNSSFVIEELAKFNQDCSALFPQDSKIVCLPRMASIFEEPGLSPHIPHNINSVPSVNTAQPGNGKHYWPQLA